MGGNEDMETEVIQSSIEVWVYRGIIAVALMIIVPIMGYGLKKFVSSVDSLKDAVSALQTAVTSLKEQNKTLFVSISENKEQHKEFDQRLDRTEKDIIKLKATNPDYLNK